jgi:hypothetical protein
MKLSPAPAYMSLTAVCTELGVGDRCGSGVCPEDGYDWYIAAP